MMMKNLPSLIKQYWLALHMKIIPCIHVRDSQHDTTYIKWHHIYLHFINVTYIDGNSDLALLGNSQLHLLVHSSQWVWT
jgi:hypothetical protein